MNEVTSKVNFIQRVQLLEDIVAFIDTDVKAIHYRIYLKKSFTPPLNWYQYADKGKLSIVRDQYYHFSYNEQNVIVEMYPVSKDKCTIA